MAADLEPKSLMLSPKTVIPFRFFRPDSAQLDISPETGAGQSKCIVSSAGSAFYDSFADLFQAG